jgi:hypothetical protein
MSNTIAEQASIHAWSPVLSGSAAVAAGAATCVTAASAATGASPGGVSCPKRVQQNTPNPKNKLNNVLNIYVSAWNIECLSKCDLTGDCGEITQPKPRKTPCKIQAVNLCCLSKHVFCLHLLTN